jgi:hypothetical protein
MDEIIAKTAALTLKVKEKKENKGTIYENNLYNKIKEVKEKEHLVQLDILPKSSTCSNTGVDIPLKLYDNLLSIEAKLNNAQMGGTSFKYDRESERLTITDCNTDSEILIEYAKKQIHDLNKYIDTLKKQEPVAFHEKNKGFPIKATTTARATLKQMGLQAKVDNKYNHPIKFLKEHYKKKGINYIQISDKGFYHLGDNPFNFPIPEVEGDFLVEIRVGFAGGKINVPQNTSVTARSAGLRIQGRIKGLKEKSHYSLDRQEDIKKLFSKDWRTATNASPVPKSDESSVQ